MKVTQEIPIPNYPGKVSGIVLTTGGRMPNILTIALYSSLISGPKV